MANAIDPTDAVNLRQVQALIGAAARSAPALSASAPAAILGAAASHTAPAARDIAALDRRTRRSGSSRDADAQRTAGPVADGTRPEAPARSGARLDQSAIAGWANVNRDGTLAASRNVGGHARHAVGEYEIAFEQPLRSCTYHATLSDIGFVSVKPGPEANSLNVQTRDYHGALTDVGFALIIVC
jgi:hypothetical protein